MIYTSGSTAMAKGVPHTHRTVMDKTHYLREWMGVDGRHPLVHRLAVLLGGRAHHEPLPGARRRRDPVLHRPLRRRRGPGPHRRREDRAGRALPPPHQRPARAPRLRRRADGRRLLEADPRIARLPTVEPVGPRRPAHRARHDRDIRRLLVGAARAGQHRAPPAAACAASAAPRPSRSSQPGDRAARWPTPHGHPVGDGELGEVWLRGAVR